MSSVDEAADLNRVPAFLPRPSDLFITERQKDITDQTVSILKKAVCDGFKRHREDNLVSYFVVNYLEDRKQGVWFCLIEQIEAHTAYTVAYKAGKCLKLLYKRGN